MNNLKKEFSDAVDKFTELEIQHLTPNGPQGQLMAGFAH